MQGYLIDVTTGRWLKENEKDEAPEEDGLEASSAVRRKQRVIPYVEDRRNILITRLSAPVSTETAVSAAIALERGIEAAFQLEDSELSSENLPDQDGRGRALFIESAEGGAGVLRRLVDDPEALRKAARTALEIMHFDPDTGEDRSVDEPDRERCVRACYDCLLSYSNQTLHEQINRHLVRDLMLKLASAQVKHAPVRSQSRKSETEDQSERKRLTLPAQPDSRLAGGAGSRRGCARTATVRPTGSATRSRASARTSSTGRAAGARRSSSMTPTGTRTKTSATRAGPSYSSGRTPTSKPGSRSWSDTRASSAGRRERCDR